MEYDLLLENSKPEGFTIKTTPETTEDNRNILISGNFDKYAPSSVTLTGIQIYSVVENKYLIVNSNKKIQTFTKEGKLVDTDFSEQDILASNLEARKKFEDYGFIMDNFIVSKIKELSNENILYKYDINLNVVKKYAIILNNKIRVPHPYLEEVFDPKDLDMGKCIRCHYSATSNQVGVYSGLGEETSDLIPLESSATLNGDFYWICVGYDYLGRKKCIADRNIQHSISWNSINNVGYVNECNINVFYNTNLIPIMTNNTFPKGIAFSSSIYNTVYEPFTAFDNLYYPSSAYWFTVNPLPQYMGYDFLNPTIVNHYSLKSVDTVGNRAPVDFTFEGYDGNNWNVLDAQQGVTWHPSNTEVKTFNILNENSYFKYRINVSAIGGGAGVAIDKFEMKYINKNLKYNFYTRLLTGGITSTDKDNEWDKIICEYDLGGLIEAGSNDIWHWNVSTRSWTSSTSINSNSKRNVRGYTSGANSFDEGYGTTNATSSVGYRPVLLIEKLSFMKYLVEDNGDIKYFDQGFKTVGSSIDSNNLGELFDAYGMSDLSLIIQNIDSLASNNPKILALSPTQLESPKLKLKAIPHPQLVLPTGDVRLNKVKNIDYFKLYANTFANGVLKIIASVDGGETWLSWNGSIFDVVDISKLDEVKEKGMDIKTFNNLTTQWNEIVKDKIRFGYYLEIDDIKDVAQVEKLEIQFDFVGRWKKAVHGKDYDYEYANDNLKVSLLTDGSYKINYQL
ncbi:hypothetical protein [Anaerophilus nitritogenes]|uniref:hypothetical protein n=1 Tax=Anaerophilus nitritogenes TaxID=2498136 RepID=UPI00101D3A44|nr:hypothetical protein [Anaerophilus nitritogenes]